MFSKKIKLFTTAILSMSLLFVACGFVFSQADLETDYPIINGEQPLTTNTYLPAYVKYLFNFAIIACGLIVLAIIITAGSRYVSSRGNPSVNRNAREQIVAGLTGLLILLSSYIILYAINPKLTFFNLDLLTSDRTPFQPISNFDGIFVNTADELPLGTLIDNETTLANNPYSTYEGLLNSKRLERLEKTGDAINEANLKLERLIDKLRIESLALKNLGEIEKNQGLLLARYAAECKCSNCRSACDFTSFNPNDPDRRCSTCTDASCPGIDHCVHCVGPACPDTCPNRANMNNLISIAIPDTMDRIDAQQIIVEKEIKIVKLFAGAINAFLSKDTTVEIYEAAHLLEINSLLDAEAKELISKADRTGMKEVEQDYGSPQKIKEDMEKDLNILEDIEMTIKSNPFYIESYYSLTEIKKTEKIKIEEYQNGEIKPKNDPATFYFLK